MKAGDTYHVDKGQSVFACSFIMRIKRIRYDTIFFDRIVFTIFGKIYYNVRYLFALSSVFDQW